MKKANLFISTLFVLSLSSCFRDNTAGNSQIIEANKNIINYSILKEELTDQPMKTLVKWQVLINEKEINEYQVKELLLHLYDSAKNMEVFESSTNPNMVYIYAFTSKEKAESEMGQWVGMLSKTKNDDQPKINISEIQLYATKSKAIEKFGLTESKRKQIWNDIINAEDRASKEAEKKYTTIATDDNYKSENLEKNIAMNKKLYKKYTAEVITKNKIGKDVLDSISKEGLMQGWAFPK